MSITVIELNKGDCQNCYKCIRECPIKAIEFKNSRASVLPDECILCGNCVQTCPQNAKYIKSDSYKIEQMIEEGKTVYATIAPSFAAYFGVSFSKLSKALKKLGFAGVEETAIGAYETSKAYSGLIRDHQMNNIIVTACSSVVMLVEKYYKDLIKCLAPVASPMMAHAKLMKEAYGDNIHIAFIGPCLAKKAEAQDELAGGYVDYALTFSGVEEWMLRKGISLEEDDDQVLGVANPISRLYPKPIGILDTIDQELFKQENAYRRVSVDGVDDCIQLFDAMVKDPSMTGLFIEANICKGACLNGPVMRMHHKDSFMSQFELSTKPLDHDTNVAPTAKLSVPQPRIFANRSPHQVQPTEEDIKHILAQIGKYSKEDELNCGSCGYSSCREKAAAVFHGKADIHMCLPYFRQQAESMSSTVIEYSPNAILVFDDDQRLLDLNPTGEKMLKIKKSESIGEFPPLFYGENDFDEARSDGEVKTKKVQIDDIYAEQSILYVKKHHMFLAFIKDITEEEKRKKELSDLRDHTVLTAQKVIEKQMTVAQEIASLLGETTAETKVALTKLKKSMEQAEE